MIRTRLMRVQVVVFTRASYPDVTMNVLSGV